MMIDDLRAALVDLGRSLDTGHAPTADRAGLALGRSRSALATLRAVLWFEAAQALILSMLLVWFLATNASSSWTALGSAAFLLVLEGAYLAATVRQHALLSHIDFAAPVVYVQRQLAALMTLRSRTVWAVLVAAPLVWIPLLIVAAKWLAGVDVVAATGLAWVAANLALGLVVLGVGVWIARRPPRWVRRSPWLRRVSDHLAGRSLRHALDHAEEVAKFQLESDP